MGVAQKEEASVETWRLTHGSGQILDPAHQMPIINAEGRKQGTAYFAVPGRFSRALLKLMRRDMPFRCNCACTFRQGTVPPPPPPPPPLTVLTYFCIVFFFFLFFVCCFGWSSSYRGTTHCSSQNSSSSMAVPCDGSERLFLGYTCRQKDNARAGNLTSLPFARNKCI